MLSRMLLGVYYPPFALLFALTTRAATVKDNDRLENGGKPPRFAPWLNENTYPNADNETMCNVIVQLPTTDTRAWQDFAIFIYIMSYDYTDMFQIENAPWGAVVEFWISDPRNLPSPQRRQYTCRASTTTRRGPRREKRLACLREIYPYLAAAR